MGKIISQKFMNKKIINLKDEEEGDLFTSLKSISNLLKINNN